MKCEEVSKELIGYLDRRVNSAEHREVEEHLLECSACRTRAEEFRSVWSALEEVPAIEPSFGFDAHVRQRIAAEPRAGWFSWFVPQPRLAFSLALLLALSVWIAKMPQHQATAPTTAANETEQFQEIQDLPVLENYEVLTKLDALSELSPAMAQPLDTERNQETND